MADQLNRPVINRTAIAMSSPSYFNLKIIVEKHYLL